MKPHKQLFYAYSALYRPYLNQINSQLAPFNLASSQWMIMHFIFRNGAHTISDISTYQHVERPTITKMVQKLIELDYMEAQSGTDKRTKFIHLTEKGQEMCAQVQGKLGDYQQGLLKGIPEADQLLVARILRDITEKITTGEG